MVQSVDNDEKLKMVCDLTNSYTTSDKARDTQIMWMLTENGVYEVLLVSRKPIAKQFKSEVKKLLHNIRTKMYKEPLPQDYATALEALARQVREWYLRSKDKMTEALGGRMLGRNVFMVEASINLNFAAALRREGYEVAEVFDGFFSTCNDKDYLDRLYAMVANRVLDDIENRIRSLELAHDPNRRDRNFEKLLAC